MSYLNQNPLGAFLESERIQRNMTLRKFADWIGVSHSTLSRYINHDELPAPDLDSLIRISEKTGVGLLELIRLSYPQVEQPLINLDAQILANRIQQLPPDARIMVETLIDGAVLRQHALYKYDESKRV